MGPLHFDGTGNDTVEVDLSVDFVENLNITTTDSLVDEDDTLNGGENFVVNVENGDRLDTITVNAELATTVAEQGDSFTALNTFDASGSAGGVTVDLSNASQGVTMTGGAGDDDFTGSAFSDAIDLGDGDNSYTGSAGADAVAIGAGANNLTFGDGVSVEGSFTSITGFNAVQDSETVDTLTLGQTVLAADVTGTNVSAADADTGTVTASIVDGIITVAGADAANIDTLAEWIDVAEILINADGDTTAESAAFEFDGNTYVIESDNTDATSTIVELVGLTGVDALGATAADNSILIA